MLYNMRILGRNKNRMASVQLIKRDWKQSLYFSEENYESE